MIGARASRPLCCATAVLLSACGGPGGWTKPGADKTAAAAAYDDCRSMADTAVRTDADIDQDIGATRGGDWQRSSTGRVETEQMNAHTRTRAGNIVDACMKAQGFSPAK